MSTSHMQGIVIHLCSETVAARFGCDDDLHVEMSGFHPRFTIHVPVADGVTVFVEGERGDANFTITQSPPIAGRLYGDRLCNGVTIKARHVGGIGPRCPLGGM